MIALFTQLKVLALRQDAQRIMLTARITQWITPALVMLFAQHMTEINPTAKHSNITRVAQEQKLSARIGTRLDHKEIYVRNYNY